MAKQLTCQKYIFKIRSSRLRKARWNLTLPLVEARFNKELVSLADSQVLRWIDELNGLEDQDAIAKEIRSRIKRLKKEENSIANKRMVKALYEELDAVQFKPDYMCLIIDKEQDYYRACKGFTINGISYHRLLGTNGGVKNSTIVFVADRHGDEIRRRIENGRNPEKALVPAKLEAYKALACSASIPVSMPMGILVVPDCETKFLADVINISDSDSGEPLMEFQKDAEIELNASDGYGLMLPSLARRWSQELGLDYITSGVNTRFSFEKGMVFTFNFMEFAERVANKYIVKDAWGDDVDIRTVELVLTTSMVKLWDSYESCQDYIDNCLSNKYTFGITKTCPEELESERALNYQFIQSYELSEADIDELIKPTMDEFKDVLQEDVNKAILFLCGKHLNENSFDQLEDGYIKALFVDDRLHNDPYVRGAIYRAIKNRINKAKVGVLNVHGNYSIISGDPYALCQSIFGLEVTGLLKAGEIYNRYWDDVGAEKCVCFRAPMTCHNNIRAVKIARSEEVRYWFQHLKTSSVLNAWDTMTQALNGCDFDGDMIFLTDNRVLVENHRELPALMCAQRKAEKKIATDEDLITANVNSFGDDIGKTTNWITSMFEVQAQYEKGSLEYETLAKRIKFGQKYQQDCIDRTKGIICAPMPRYWHDRHAVNIMANPEDRRFALSIVADRKPYFMRLIYPDLMRQYNTYIKNTNKNALREFGITMDELLSIGEDQRTERQSEFVRYYKNRMPVGTNDCVMNIICKKFEQEFDGFLSRRRVDIPFDYKFLRTKSGYSRRLYDDVKRLFDNYNQRLKKYKVFAEYEKVDDFEWQSALVEIEEEFERVCTELCPDENMLCNVILDLCYTKSSTKRFAWRMCGSTIIRNLLEFNNGVVKYPIPDDSGDISYAGKRFSLHKKELSI